MRLLFVVFLWVVGVALVYVASRMALRVEEQIKYQQELADEQGKDYEFEGGADSIPLLMAIVIFGLAIWQSIAVYHLYFPH